MIGNAEWNKAIHEVYVIDCGLKDIDNLISGLPTEATRRRLEQMPAILSAYRDLSTISHGSEGSLQLYSTLLSAKPISMPTPTSYRQ